MVSGTPSGGVGPSALAPQAPLVFGRLWAHAPHLAAQRTRALVCLSHVHTHPRPRLPEFVSSGSEYGQQRGPANSPFFRAHGGLGWSPWWWRWPVSSALESLARAAGSCAPPGSVQTWSLSYRGPSRSSCPAPGWPPLGRLLSAPRTAPGP